MKVEFIQTHEYGDYGVSLRIKASEFLKADKNQDEITSMCAAINAYCVLASNSDYFFKRENYNLIKEQLKNNDVVIFATSIDRPRHFLLTYIVHEGIPREVLSPIKL